MIVATITFKICAIFGSMAGFTVALSYVCNGPYNLMEISLFNVLNESTYIINNFNRGEDDVIINCVDYHCAKQLQHEVNS